MYLSAILDSKGSTVITSAPHRTLVETIALLTEKRIGAVAVVSGDGEVLGIISERDVIRALAERGEAALHDAVSKHMTARIVPASRDMTVDEAMGHMTNGRFRHMPVIENGRLAGMISIGDVVKHRLEDIEREKQSILDYIGTA
jgi:CBS domain-containing protein